MCSPQRADAECTGYYAKYDLIEIPTVKGCPYTGIGNSGWATGMAPDPIPPDPDCHDTTCTYRSPSVRCTEDGWKLYYLADPNTYTAWCATARAPARLYSCATNELVFSALGNTDQNPHGGGVFCVCDPADTAYMESIPQGIKFPMWTSYNFPPEWYEPCSADCATSPQEPEDCDGLRSDNIAPFDRGCGMDEHNCSPAPFDADQAPVRFSSGRVQSNPITLFHLDTPGDVFFGYRLSWNSHVRRVAAATRTSAGYQESEPTIHAPGEVTHFLGEGWQDNFSDRLLVDVRGKATDIITWQSMNSTVTFSAASNWFSSGGKYQLLDRGANPPDGFGRWVIKTTNASSPRKVWTFEDVAYTDAFDAGTTYTLGRLRRHAVQSADSDDYNGLYGFTVNWMSNGTLSSVRDDLGRELTFSYSSTTLNNVTWSRSLSAVKYRATSSVAPVDIATLQMTHDARQLDRIERPGTNYTRFLYTSPCPTCRQLLGDVLLGSNSTPDIQAPPQVNEIELEHNEYLGSATPEQPIGVRSRYPGREYAYEYTLTETTQFDLHQPATCPAGICPPGVACMQSGECYVADVMTHDSATRLPTSRRSSGTGANGNSNSFASTYTPFGALKSSEDASGVNTTYGYDSMGRVRCIVRHDDDEEAFVDPLNPDTSACAGPTNSQTIRVDYNGPCTDGYTSCKRTTTPSVLSGVATEEVDLDPLTLLPLRTKSTGQSRDIIGALVTDIHSSTAAYDEHGRVLELDGPLDDAIALDKTTITYWGPSDGMNNGQVRYVTKYVGTNASHTTLTTEYSDYDAWGIPHLVKFPNGNMIRATTTDHLNWTLEQLSPSSAVLSTSTLTLNADGTVKKTVDADGVCLTFEYTDTNGYVGAPTRIRRSSNDSSCGNLPIDINNGEVEIRTYTSGEKERLASVERRLNGTTWFSYSGFLYDRDRRLSSADTMRSPSSYEFTYTDIIATGVTSPEAPAAGTSKTERAFDEFARPSSLLRFIDNSGNKLTHLFSYASAFSPRPTQMTRGLNGFPAAVSTFEYDDFGRLVTSTVPEAGASGAPGTSRYEYDAADRLSRRRTGIDSPLVRTDEYTYDSLGRTLAVNYDLEHSVDCGTAAAGTPLQDEEYVYDSCPSGDVPSGFACSHALGRLTIARAIVQCGTAGTAVKRGRWYDYDERGRVARVAYATVTGPSIGTPAIMNYTWTTEGRIAQYSSPINPIYGTRYVYGNTGKISEIDTTESSPQMIANAITWYPFGPLWSLVGNVSQSVGTETRTLRFGTSYESQGALGSMHWWLAAPSEIFPSIAFIFQGLDYTAAGLIRHRWDYADYEASRYYEYDSLLRLTCEARGQTSTATFPESAHCTSSSQLVAGLFTYSNGDDVSHPPDVRRTAYVRSEDASYVSPSLETSIYASGASQVQQVNRATSSLIVGYDELGRRRFEYDSLDPTRSRRDYAYLPNGQLGTITGRDPNNAVVSTSLRYDDAGHPITITDRVGKVAGDSYELFWSDSDLLLAANITFGSSRACGSSAIRGGALPIYCTGVRWHYHYLGRRLIAATRELVYSGIQAPLNRLKRFWVISDERGLVHRLVDNLGYTWWQARWDASGSRTWVGTPQPEMWVPFGLPGQVVLGSNVVFTDSLVLNNTSSRTRWGTEAYASGGGGAWTRPAIALNRWRAYDPLLSAFLQPDPLDPSGRLQPEGYVYARSSMPNAVDPSGLASIWNNCDTTDFSVWTAAMVKAYIDISKCTDGECGFPGGENVRREWQARLVGVDTVQCVDHSVPGYIAFREEDGAFMIGGKDEEDGEYAASFPDAGPFGDSVFVSYYRNPREQCPAQIYAHEALHLANYRLPAHDLLPARVTTSLTLQDILSDRMFFEPYADLRPPYDKADDTEEGWVSQTAEDCIKCNTGGWPRHPVPPVPEAPIGIPPF